MTYSFAQKLLVPLARIALFTMYTWFGVLKIIGLSPASPLVQKLFEVTIPYMPFSTFIILFGAFEVLIGVLFIIPRCERVALPLFFLHMCTTVMPLFCVPSATWSATFIPTLEGQYIIKNLALIVCALTIAADLHSKSVTV